MALDSKRIAAARGNDDTGFMTDAVTAERQGIADFVRASRLRPNTIQAGDVAWRPATSRAAEN